MAIIDFEFVPVHHMFAFCFVTKYVVGGMLQAFSETVAGIV